MRLAARRRHHTLAYFKAHHHAGYVRNLMHRFAKSLKAKIAAHTRSIKAHNVAKKNRASAKKARHAAHAAVKRSHTHLRRSLHAVNAARRVVLEANLHVKNMTKNLRFW